MTAAPLLHLSPLSTDNLSNSPPAPIAKREKRHRLNVQGLARRDPGLMRCLRPDTGWTTVSIDLSAGEPSVTAHFSQDRRYRYATVDGVGKRPFYEDGVLMIDDIYIMVMSVSPIHRDAIAKLFDAGLADRWMENPDAVRNAIKRERQFTKILALGLGYGMGAKKMVSQAYNAGYTLTLAQAKAFYRAYWDLFSGVRALADKLAALMEKRGSVVNPFGYRLTCAPRKAYNFYIQSSVSGILHVFLAKLMAAAPWSLFVTCIHDELVMDVPTVRLDEFRAMKELAVLSLNEDLRWSVPIRCGFSAGKDWYEAK